MQILLVQSDAEIDRCFPAMAQLRPELPHETFVERVRRQMLDGYQMAYIAVDGTVIVVAGFRLGESLPWGRHVYVDDLVTDANHRSAGHGQRMFDWLVDYARRNGCESLHLESGVQRFDAHRFYLRNRMRITSHHFALGLGG